MNDGREKAAPPRGTAPLFMSRPKGFARSALATAASRDAEDAQQAGAEQDVGRGLGYHVARAATAARRADDVREARAGDQVAAARIEDGLARRGAALGAALIVERDLGILEVGRVERPAGEREGEDGRLPGGQRAVDALV